MQVGNITINQLFYQPRRYVVPLYQRPYIWQQQIQWEPLWEDIRTVAERLIDNANAHLHFLGAIVLEYVPQHTGAMQIRLVIDGQQRLTTIQLLLEALYDYCGYIGATKLHQAVEMMVRNDDPLSTNPIECYKVWPTNVDRSHFQRVMEAKSPDELKQMYEKPVKAKQLGHSITDAYLYFSDTIAEWAEEDLEQREARLRALILAIRDQVGLVVIDVEKGDDAQVIFETLNARGTPLLPSDLVKNHLFHRANQDGENLDTLYQQYWQPFDDGKQYWRQDVGRGHAKRARIDLFLQNYLSLLRQDEIPVAHLYATFRETSNLPDAEKAKGQLKQLRRYADIYRGFENFQAGSSQALFFNRLFAMELGTTYPFLLELFAVHGKESQEVIQTLNIIESYLVRRLVCQLTTRSYGRLFIDLIANIKGPLGGLPERVRTTLANATGESARWPDDEEFRLAWMNAPLFRTLLRSRLRMILEALDQAMDNGYSETYVIKDQLTVEHLLPQEWKTHWPLPLNATADMVTGRMNAIHTLGNLTLLTKKLNPVVSNSPWAVKVPELKKHSKLNLTQNLLQYWSEEWGEAQILERGNRLFELALQIWKK